MQRTSIYTYLNRVSHAEMGGSVAISTDCGLYITLLERFTNQAKPTALAEAEQLAKDVARALTEAWGG